jgi:hypothetical protein
MESNQSSIQLRKVPPIDLYGLYGGRPPSVLGTLGEGSEGPAPVEAAPHQGASARFR